MDRLQILHEQLAAAKQAVDQWQNKVKMKEEHGFDMGYTMAQLQAFLAEAKRELAIAQAKMEEAEASRDPEIE